jgi:hypothetical protein
MLYQLKTGRTIEISIEQYLDMTDEELQDLEGLSNYDTKDINNPWYARYSKGTIDIEKELTDEYNLIDIPIEVKLADKYFQNPDDE